MKKIKCVCPSVCLWICRNSKEDVLKVSQFLELGVQPTRFSGSGNSTNQVVSSWTFDQSSFLALGFHSIRSYGEE